MPAQLLSLVLAAAAIAAPIPAARSQDRAMQDRLDRLERDLTMLQRQVYRGGPAPVMPGGSGCRGRYRIAHGPARNPDARADRAGRGRGERGRAAAPPARADQQRHRGAASAKASGQPRSAAVELACRAPGISDASPSPGRADRHARACPGVARRPPRPADSLMPPGTLVPPPRDTAGGERAPSRLPGRCRARSRRISPGRQSAASRRRAARRLGFRAVQSRLSAC